MTKSIHLHELKEYIERGGFDPYPWCYKCGKTAFPTQQAARIEGARMRQLKGGGRTYPYQCLRGHGWHLTAKQPRGSDRP